MTGQLFFLSYARDDAIDDPYSVVDRFYKDLVRLIRLHTGQTEIGFRDTTDVRTGDRWPNAIETALRACRAFVPVLSPTYLASTYCGKEWTAFSSRLVGNPPLIVPVLLAPRSRIKAPREITDIADSHDEFPGMYVQHGLEVLVRQGRKKDYEALVTAFATRLLDVVEQHPLEPAPSIPAIDTIPSAFHGNATVPTTPLADSGEGPRYAQFLLVAARPDELATVRRSVAGYSDHGSIAWRPWHPDFDREVSRLVGQIALDEGFLPTWITVDDHANVAGIEQAYQRGNVVIVVADPWTLRIEPYHSRMKQIDAIGYMNCVVAILWNERDDETVTATDQLDDAVRLAFANRFAFRDPSSFLHRVCSADDLRKELAIALAKTGARLRDHGQVLRRAERGGVLVAKPELSVPAGGDG